MSRQMEQYRRILVAILSVVLGLMVCYELDLLHKQQITATTRIAEQIVRFHVIPDHDSEVDQRLKRLVRDDMLQYLSIKQEELESTRKNSKEDFIREIKDSIPEMETLAKSRITAEGFSYPVEVTCKKDYYSQRKFEQYIFPEGTYDTIAVLIGEGEGSNWWGVMYPNLCLTKESYKVFYEKTDIKLQGMLSAEDYESLLYAPKEKVRIKCRAIELIRELR